MGQSLLADGLRGNREVFDSIIRPSRLCTFLFFAPCTKQKLGMRSRGQDLSDMYSNAHPATSTRNQEVQWPSRDFTRLLYVQLERCQVGISFCSLVLV